MNFKKPVKFAFTIPFFFSVFLIFFSVSSHNFFQGIVQAKTKIYLIGPGDILSLKISAGGEIQKDVDLTVSDEGIINVPFIGPVKAKGLTISKLENVIAKPLAMDYFVNPRVNIQAREYHHIKYYISGAVRSPGLYKTPSEITVMELLAKAEGVLSTSGNIAYIQRADSDQADKKEAAKNAKNRVPAGEPIKVDLLALLNKGDMSHNILLKSGDAVYIPLEKSLDLGTSKIYVEGEVKRPGVYNYQPGMTALGACILAGGFGKYAAPNRTRIIRKEGNKKVIIKKSLNDVKKGKIVDIKLKPGDLIHVPETWL